MQDCYTGDPGLIPGASKSQWDYVCFCFKSPKKWQNLLWTFLFRTLKNFSWMRQVTKIKTNMAIFPAGFSWFLMINYGFVSSLNCGRIIRDNGHFLQSQCELQNANSLICITHHSRPLSQPWCEYSPKCAITSWW